MPLDGVVRNDWQDLVADDKHGGGINRITYEWCVLTTLREKVRCKEVWVRGADRFRNPDEDLPEDFDARREEYYAALEQPRDAKAFVETLRGKAEGALAALDANLPNNLKVAIAATKRGKARIRLTPLDEQPEPPNIIKLTASLVERWPMTNLLDILKETELRVRFTDVFRTVGSREVLPSEVLQRRLLLCLHGRASTPDRSACAAAAGTTVMPICRYVRRRYVTKEHAVRDRPGVNAIFGIGTRTFGVMRRQRAPPTREVRRLGIKI